jgi:DNA invertase Pin-like site-specific DNA recombinase
MKALVYAPVSTDPQERDGTSLDTQEKRCRVYAREQGWEGAPILYILVTSSSLARVRFRGLALSWND